MGLRPPNIAGGDANRDKTVDIGSSYDQPVDIGRTTRQGNAGSPASRRSPTWQSCFDPLAPTSLGTQSRSPQIFHLNRLWLTRAGVGQTAPTEPTPTEQAGEHVVPKEAVKLYEQGMALRKKGKWEKAKVLFEKALVLDPKYYDARLEMILVSANLGEDPEGEEESTIRFIEGALEQYPDVFFINRALAELYAKQKRWPDTVRCLKRALEVAPDDPWLHFKLGRCWWQLGQHDQSIAAHKKSVELDPKNPYAYSILGGIYMARGNKKEAILFFERATELGSEAWDDYMLLAGLYYEEGKTEKALVFFEKAYRLDTISNQSDLMPGYLRYVSLLMEKGELDKALEIARHCRFNFPDDPRYHFAIAEILYLTSFERSGFERTAEHYRIALEKGLEKPWSIQASFNLASVLTALNRHEEAIVVLKGVVTQEVDEENSGRAYGGIGYVLIQQGRFKEALPYLKKAYAILPDNEALCRDLSLVYDRLGDHQRAVDFLNDALKKDPDNKYLYWFAFASFWLIGERGRALSVIREVADKFADDAEFHVWHGDALRWYGDYEKAIEEYEKARQLEPLIPIGVSIGECLISLNRAREAIAVIEQEYKADRQNRFARFMLGKALFEAGDYIRAIDLLKAFLEGSPKFFYGYVLLTSAYLAVKKHDRAVKAAKSFVDAVPRERLSHVFLADTLQKVGRFGEAMDEYQRAIELDPKEGDSYHYFGRALYEEGQQEKAREVLKRGLRAAPQSSRVHFSLAYWYEQEADYERAIHHYEKAIEYDRRGEGIGVHFNLANTYMRYKKYPEAEAEYRQALTMNPGAWGADLRRAVALALWLQGRHQAAIEELYRARKMYPAHAMVRYDLARALQLDDKVEEALAELKDFLAANPQEVISHMILGDFFAMIDRWDNAERSYRQALELRPDDPMILNNLGYMFACVGKIEEGTRYLDKALALKPGDPFIQDSLGYAYFKAGRYDEAIDLYRRALKRLQELKIEGYEIYQHLGIALLQQGSLAEAITYLERALNINPEDEETKKALQVARAKQAGEAGAELAFPQSLQDTRRLTTAVYARDLPISIQALSDIERDVEAKLRAAEINLLTDYSRRLMGGRRPAGAVALLRRSIELDPANSQLYVRMGDALMQLGRYDQARKNYEKALQLDPSSNGAERGLNKAIRKLQGSLSSLGSGLEKAPAVSE